jgi:hypothetical protein
LYDRLEYPHKFVKSATQLYSPKDEGFFTNWRNYIEYNAK